MEIKKINELLIYNKIAHSDTLKNIEFINDIIDENIEKSKHLLHKSISQIVEMADKYGMCGNLWKAYITHLLVLDENAYSKASETVGEIEGSINSVALHDFEIIKNLYDYDLITLGKTLDVAAIDLLNNYSSIEQPNKLLNSTIVESIKALSKELDNAKTADEFKKAVTAFYKNYGVGQIGLHKAFRIDDINAQHHKPPKHGKHHHKHGKPPKHRAYEIIPITNIRSVYLNDLVGYEIPKKQLVDNTEAFLAGKQANNCLLYGDAGTGKSTCIKAIANEYYTQGLRIIEVYKHQFKYLNDVIAQIKNRNYKFIIYLDDLSFEEFEIEYKFLKAIIEGSLEKKPDNILVYATSNRRHLIKETFNDRIGMEVGTRDINTTETMQEKMSLAARFGESIYFGEPTRVEFLEIVEALAKRNKIEMSVEELHYKANQWELRHADQSGRTAQQFIDHLLATAAC